MSTTAIEIPQDRFNLTKLSDVTVPETFDDAVSLFRELGIQIDTAAAVMPDEFPEIDKKNLVNVPVMLLTWNISRPGESETGNQYIVVRGITRSGKRFRFTDGSTGIFRQLVALTEKRMKEGIATPNAGLIVEKGLVKSDYTFTDDSGKQQSATTFYLANE